MQNKKSNAPFIVAALALIVFLAGVAFIFMANEEEEPSSSSQTVNTVAEDVPYPNIERIDVDAAHGAIQSGAAIMLDVRDAASYEANHATGAISMPESEVAERMNELPKDQLIITYCT